MRKFLLSAVALLMTATMLAVGKGDGSSQANAIDFDWDGTYIHEGNKTSWHCIKLSELNEEADDPTVALYLTNLTNETANVELSGSAFLRFPYPVSLFVDDIDLLQYAGEDATETYKIDGKKHVVWTMPTSYDLSGITDAKVKDALSDAFGDIKNVSLIQLVEYGLSTVDLKVYSSQKIAISADVYETAEIVDDACTKAVDFDWAGETVAAGETWFYLDLNAVKTSNKKLNFVVENNGGADANVAFDLYADCPASAILLDYDWAIAAGSEVKEALGRFFLDQMTRDYVYLKLTTDQAVTLKAEEEVLPPPVVLFDPSGAPVLEVGKEYVLNGETVLKVDLAALKAPKGYKTVCHIVNPNDAAVNLKQEIAFATPVTSNNVQEKNLLVAAGAELEMNIPNKQIENVKSGVGYYRFTTDDVLTVMMEHVKLETSTTKPSTPTILAPSCADSYEFDWNSTIKQKALTSKWYELDIAPLKNNKEHVQLAFTNHTDAMILVFGAVKLDCNSKDSIPFVCPVPAGTPVNKVLDYSLLAASPLEKVYVSLTMVPTKVKDLGDLASIRSKADVVDLVSLDLGAEMSVKAKRISALVDPTYCETTHQTMTTGVEYIQEAGETKWYRVTDDFVKNNLGLLEKFTIINQGAKDANVTFGVTVDCKYGIATTIDQKIPRWFDITTAYPSGLFRLVDAIVADEITEFYLSVKSDQPLLFGFDLDYGTTLGCDSAIVFDWEKGATINNMDAQWYNFDLTKIKGSGKHLKLTFTNPTDEIVWVASAVSLTCPLKVVAPAIVPVLPGTSVDKVIDYSFVATSPINNVYVAVIAEGQLKLGASLIDATVEEPLNCINHVEVKTGERYVHNAGTTWYKFSNELLEDMGKAPRFTFENLSSNTITLSAGMTVDCEYGILTRAKAKIPAQVLGKPIHHREFSFRIPRIFFQAVRKLIDPDVTELMIQLTANNPFAFSIDMKAEDACEDAQEFNWEGCFDLKANESAWYKVDMNTPLNSTKPLTVALYNNSDFPVIITSEVSPTCPSLISMVEKYEIAALDSAIVSVKPEKVAEMIKEYSDYLSDLSCYTRFHATGDVTICVNDERIVNPDDPTPDEPCCPEECDGVHVLDWRKVKLSEIELNKLYKLDITGLYEKKQNINFFVNNDVHNDTVGIVSEIYAHCQDEAPVATHKNNVLAGMRRVEVAHDKFAALVNPEQCCMFVKFTAIDTIPVTPVVPPTPDPCANVPVLNWRAGIKLSQLEEDGWYKLEVASVHADKADVMLSVENDSTCQATVSAALYTTCQVDDAVLEGTAKLNAGAVGDTLISYNVFNGMVESHVEYLYMHINTLKVADDCDPCANVETLAWENGIKLTQLKEGRMYKLDLSNVQAAQSAFSIKAENDLGYKARVSAVAYSYCEANEDNFLGDATKQLAADYVAETMVPYADLYGAVGYATEVYVVVTEITEIPVPVEKDTVINNVTEFVCDGTEYVDLQGEKHIVSSLIDPALLTWTTTVETETTVTIYNYVITPIVAPVAMTAELLATIPGAMPKLVAGENVDVTGTLDAIKNYYEDQDTEAVADVESVEWTAGANATLDCEAEAHTMTLTLTAGCDFVITTTLTLAVEGANEYVEYTEVACDSYVWNGVTYTESGDYTYNTTTAAGCERVEVLHLTINKSERVEFTETACDSYVWNGVTYTESGDYTYTTTTAAGCERVEVLHLTINKSEREEYTETACDSYVWNGVTYTESGDYTYNTTTAAGCERVEVLHLTINKSEHVEFTETACDSYVWNGVTYTESGDYTYNTTTAAGCERVEVLHLTINKTVYEDITVTECYSYTWYGETYVRDTVVSVTVAGDNGCDRVETLHLTITAETPEANPAFSNVVAVPKYGNRMIVLHLNDFAKDNAWTPANGQVAWYQVVGEMDNSWEIVDDQPLGSGMYIENLNGFTGEIYAIIDASNGGACGSLYRTAKITLDPVAQAPKLMPTVANPSETLHLTNLNPSNVTEVRVFNTNGELMATYEAEAATEFVFKAAVLPGYYMVEVQNNGEQTTLRYIVK